jgi:hypothetical protein
MESFYRPPESFNVPQPSRDDPDIQSFVYAKAEYRECLSGPDPFADKRISKKYFNSQVLFQRLLSAYGSMMLLFQQSAGKTGCIACYHEYITKEASDEIITYYYVSAKLQGTEFQEQVVGKFGTDEDKEALAGATGEFRRTIFRRALKSKNIVKISYGKLAEKIDSIEDNDMLIRTFANTFIAIDEFQEIKLTESKDMSKKEAEEDRKRLQHYKSYWRLFRLCPTCVVVLATGTPITDDIREFTYAVNLLPNTKQIWTELSWSIATEVCEKYEIPLESLGLEEGGPNWSYEYEVDDEDIDNRERALEEVIRGRVMYIRAPATSVIITPMDEDELEILADRYRNKDEFVRDWANVVSDPAIGKTITEVYMSEFQTIGYLYSRTKHGGGLLVEASQSSVFVFPTEPYARSCLKRKVGIQGTNETMLSNMNFEDTYGGKGFKNCFEKTVEKKVSTYTPKGWFRSYLRNDDCLKNSGKIIWDVVWLSQLEDVFPVYVTSKNLKSCLLVILYALSERGYTIFTGKEPLESGEMPLPGKRVALISPKQLAQAQNILRVWGHPDNVTGKYIKTLLVSPVGATGLNIPNAGNCCVIEPQHNSAKIRQAVARIFRPTSHEASTEYVKKKFGMDRFPVYVHYYVPILWATEDVEALEEKGINTIDYVKTPKGLEGQLDMLEVLKKLIPARSPNRYLLNKIMDKERESSHWAIYASAYEKDRREASLFRSIKRIAVDCKINEGRNTRDDIPDNTFESDYQLTKYEPYNCDDTLPIDYSTYESYYIGSKRLWDDPTILSSLSNIEHTTSKALLESIKGKTYTDQEMLASLRRIVETQKVIGSDYLGFPLTLQEDSGIFYPSSDYFPESSSNLISYNQVKTFTHTVQVDDEIFNWIDEETLEVYKEELLDSDNPKMYLFTVPNTYQCALIEAAIVEKINGISSDWSEIVIEAYINLLTEIERPLHDNIIVHQVNSLYSGYGSDYVAVDNIVNAKKHIRIYTDSTWRSCTEDEKTYYSKFLNQWIEDKLQEYYAVNEDIGFIGVIVRNDKIHIRNFSKIKGIYKSKGKGHNAFTAEIKDLLDMLYKCSEEEHNVEVSKQEKKKLLAQLRKETFGKNPLAAGVLSKFDGPKLKFYMDNVPPKQSKTELSKRLCKKLMERNAIFAIVGDVKAIVKDLTK